MRSLLDRIKRYFVEDLTLSRVLKNTGYLFSSNTLSLILSFIQSIFAARLLGLAAFGLIGIVTSFVSNVNRLFSFRMGEFIIRYLGKELTRDNSEKAGAVVKVALITEGLTSLFAFGFFMLVAPLGAKYIAKDMQFQLFGISILANAFYETSIGLLQITNHFRAQAGINLAQSFLTAIIIMAAYILQGSIYTVLIAYLVGKIILGISPVLLALYHLRREVHPGWWKASFSLLPPFKEMARYTISTNLSGTIKMIVSAVFMLLFGKAFIGWIYGEDFVPAYSATMILLAGFGFSNIFFWNRSLLLSFGKANIPLYVLFTAAALKVGLSFWIVPKFGIIGEASLLSGNFILSVGMLVFIGIRLIKWHEQHDLKDVG